MTDLVGANSAKTMQGLHIQGRRWRDIHGNTYHKAVIYIDGEHVHTSKLTYGYEDHYLQTAEKWLEDNAYLPFAHQYSNGVNEALWQYCERKGIKFVRYADDFDRKKDL